MNAGTEKVTEEAFVSKYLDELLGLLLAAFAAEENTRGIAQVNLAHRGAFLRDSVGRARNLLKRMYAAKALEPEARPSP